MIIMEEEYMVKLETFVEAYLLQKESMESDDKSEKEMTAIVLDYMRASSDLLEFISVVFEQEDPELPKMEVFFSEGRYHDFAYRIYAAVWQSGQIPEEAEWHIFTMVYIGTLLRERWDDYFSKEEII